MTRQNNSYTGKTNSYDTVSFIISLIKTLINVLYNNNETTGKVATEVNYNHHNYLNEYDI